MTPETLRLSPLDRPRVEPIENRRLKFYVLNYWTRPLLFWSLSEVVYRFRDIFS